MRIAVAPMTTTNAPSRRVRPLVGDEPRRDPLVDDVGLLEEQLPRGDGRADDRDDQKHRVGADAALHAGHHEVVADRTPVRLGQQGERNLQQADGDEQEHRLFPAPEAAARGDRDQHQGGHRHRDVRAHAEVAQRERDADELRDDRQEVQDEQVADAEPAPEPAEPLVDQPRVSHAGDRAEPDDHLLVDDQHRDEQQQRPQQAVPVVLARLRVGGHAAGVVVADHHDDAGADDGQEGDQAAAQAGAPLVVHPDAAERALDVAEVSVVEHRGRRLGERWRRSAGRLRLWPLRRAGTGGCSWRGACSRRDARSPPGGCGAPSRVVTWRLRGGRPAARPPRAGASRRAA